MLNFLFEKTPLYLMTQSFWRDEGFSYLMSDRGFFEIIKTTARDFNPPFYYLILHFWMKIFGTTEVILRSLSFSFFAINIYFVFLFLKDIFRVNNKRIWLYVLLFSFNPFLFYYAFEVRMYSLVALLTTLSFYYFLQKKHTKYLLFSILGIYTHYFFIFVIFVQLFYCFFIEKKDFVNWRRIIMIPLVFFLPWFFYVYPNITKNTVSFWMTKTNAFDLISSLGVLFTAYERLYKFYDNSIILITIAFVLLIGCGVFNFNKLRSRRRFKQRKLFGLLLIWSFLFYFLVLFISFVKPIFVVRYLIFTVVGFNLLIFYLLEFLLNEKLRIISFLLIFYIIFDYSRLGVVYKRKGDVRSTISEIKKLATKKDYLFIAGSYASSYFSAVYYFNKERTYVYRERSGSLPYYIGMVLIPKDKIVTRLPIYPKKAFILKNDNSYEIKSAW